MKKIMENGNEFIQREIKRIKNLIESKISENKKIELNEKINILSKFKLNQNKEL